MLRTSFALIAIALACPGGAKVVETLQYTTYEVPYHDGVPLIKLLQRASPVHVKGAVVVAWTTPRVSWKPSFVTLPGGHCRIKSVTTALTVTITLPGPSDHTLSDDGDFRVFVTRVKTHELGHYQIAHDAALEIDRGILRLPESHSCGTLQAAVNRLGNEIWGEQNAKQAAYDNGTEHGKAQGAWLRY
jgi:predicted secreted Zn-dependent protease